MRIALFSDTHGNLPATEAVLAAIVDEQPEQIVCLGDVAMFGPQPRAVLAAVAELGCPVVMGNTDAWALDPEPHPERDELTTLYNVIEGWGAAQLTADDQRLIRTFQSTVRMALGDGNTLLCYHGSPRSFHEGIEATTPDADLDEILGDEPALICAGGHTHTQMVRRHRHRLIINPGSVGLPFVLRYDDSAYNPPWAEYAMIDYRAPSDIQVELRRVPVDVKHIIDTAIASGMPMADRWLADWSAR
jgi:predicted phosphodiesterase